MNTCNYKHKNLPIIIGLLFFIYLVDEYQPDTVHLFKQNIATD